MAVAVAKLAVQITGNADGFLAAAKKAERGTKQLSDRLDVAGRRGRLSNLFGAGATRLASMAAGMVGFSQALGMVRGEMERLDRVGKISDRLGISAELLQTLQKTFTLAGVEAGQLDQALVSLNRRLGQVALTGKGEAVPALEALGLNSEEFLRLNLDEQIRRIWTETAKIESPAQRSAIAMALFGRGGRDLIAVFRDSPTDLATFQEELIRTGEIVDGVRVKSIEKANDQLTRFTEAFKTNFTIGVLNRLKVLERLPGVNEGEAAGFGARIGSNLAQIGWNPRELISTIFQAFGQTATSARELDEAMRQLTATLQSVNATTFASPGPG